jgi:hypothetical protein
LQRVARLDDEASNVGSVDLSGTAAHGINRAVYDSGMQNGEAGRSLTAAPPDSVGKE